MASFEIDRAIPTSATSSEPANDTTAVGSSACLSSLFAHMEVLLAEGTVVDYAVSQTSLEQVR